MGAFCVCDGMCDGGGEFFYALSTCDGGGEFFYALSTCDGGGEFFYAPSLMSSLLHRSGKRLSPSFQEFIKRHGQETITSLAVHRSPVSDLTHNVLNVLLFGQWESIKKTHGLQVMFHYCIIINETYLLEKTAIPIMKYDVSLPPGSEKLPIPWNPSEYPTLSAFLEKGMERYGDELFSYHMEINSCEAFVEKLLYANGVLSTNEETFVRQDVTALMNSIPTLSKVLVTIAVHLHAIIQYIYEEFYHVMCDVFQRCLHMIASICYFCMFMMESLVCILYTNPSVPEHKKIEERV